MPASGLNASYRVPSSEKLYAQVAHLICPAMLLALMISGVFLTGCGSDPTPPGRNIIVGLESNPTQLDPRLSQDAVSGQVQRFIFNRLISRDENNKPRLELAESWERPPQLIHRFRIRPNVRFHDGALLTSADIKYPFDSIRDPALASPHAAGLRELDRIETPSPDIVVFYLKEPSAGLTDSLMLGIVPRGAGNAGRKFGENPVGTGPFRFTRFDQDERIELTANNKYFAGPPKYDRLIFRILPEETVRILELESGGLTMIQNAFSPDILPRLAANPRLKILKREGTNFTYLGFNMNDPILSRLKVRKAIAHAIDRKPIVKHILKGLATLSDSLLPQEHWAHPKGLPSYDHNPALAKKLLDEAGFPDPDGKGPLPRFTLVYKTSQNELRRRIATVIGNQLRRVGIHMRVRAYEWGTFFGDIRSGNFQLYSLTWVGISDPDIYRYIFHSRFTPPNGLNRGHYKNSRVDALVDEARSLVEPGERATLYAKAQRLIAGELPYVNLWHSVNVAAIDRRVSGYRVYPNEDLISLANARLAEPSEKGR
ncbi:MAG: ABC transporter substrate-binding protein [Nitrospinaceae bacterium]|nr:ABC transporter substrate-binding protein [Nitrospinaceae bacterium]